MIVFVGIFSILFLNRRLSVKEWGGIILVIGGLSLVGLADFYGPSGHKKDNVTTILTEDMNKTTSQVILGNKMQSYLKL